MTSDAEHPEDDAHLPRAQRRHPFRAANPAEAAEVREEVSDVLTSVDDMLYQLARKHLLNRDEMVDDVVQRARIHLATTSLPAYDAWRLPRVKVSTFIYQCAKNCIWQQVRVIFNRKRPLSFAQNFTDVWAVEVAPTETEWQVLPPAPDRRLDDRVAAIAADVLNNPEKYMTAAQVEVFRAVTQNRTLTMKDLAKRLGYGHASSLSTMLRRIRERITEISIEDFEHPSESPTIRGTAKLADDQITEIVRRAKAGELPAALADEFGISRSYVSAIKRGRTRRSRSAQNNEARAAAA